ncbi:conserved hypothetical protein [Xanthomonas phaseoli pv. phaseoli]|nr:conserved hypothetical protein [Xanthomonas phaseoli pv. phaseoli]
MLDAWRMVAARRRFDGRIPLSAMTRLQGSLVDTDGECVYSLQFDQDPLLKVAYVELSIDVELPLACQRSLQRFLYPVQIRQRLGLIRDEADEAALPAEYEALLVPEDGMLRAVDMIEDELVLSVPVVPVAPDSEAIDAEWVPTQEEQDKASPFAALAALKKQYPPLLRAVRQVEAGVERAVRLNRQVIELKLEQSHGCAEIPCHPVPPRPASFARCPDRQAAVDRPDQRRDPSAPPHHR